MGAQLGWVSLRLPQAQLSLHKSSSTAADITAPSLQDLLDQKTKTEEAAEAAEPPALFDIKQRITAPGQDFNTLP